MLVLALGVVHPAAVVALGLCAPDADVVLRLGAPDADLGSGALVAVGVEVGLLFGH